MAPRVLFFLKLFTAFLFWPKDLNLILMASGSATNYKPGN